MKNSNNSTNEFDSEVDFNRFPIKKRTISVDGKPLPIKIGDKISLDGNPESAKTVMAITVYEDNRVQYMLEWYNSTSGEFNNEMVTLNELKLLNRNQISHIKKQIGFEKNEH